MTFLQTPELGVTEHVAEDSCKFAVWTGKPPQSEDKRIIKVRLRWRSMYELSTRGLGRVRVRVRVRVPVRCRCWKSQDCHQIKRLSILLPKKQRICCLKSNCLPPQARSLETKLLWVKELREVIQQFQFGTLKERSKYFRNSCLPFGTDEVSIGPSKYRT